MSYPPRHDWRKERNIMKMRSDSPFAKLTEEQCDRLLEASEALTLDLLVKTLEKAPEPIHCSVGALSKFLKRVAEDRALREGRDSEEAIEEFAKRGEMQGKVREAVMAAMRDRMFKQVIESNNGDRLEKTFETMSAEKEKERMYVLEERKVKVAEENAKLGWRKLECENARSGVKLLPKALELLTDANRSFEERVNGAIRLLQVEGAKLMGPEQGPKLLVGERDGNSS